MAGLSEVLALSGETEEAEKIATNLKLFAPDSPLSRYRQALLAIAFGDKERALSPENGSSNAGMQVGWDRSRAKI